MKPSVYVIGIGALAFVLGLALFVAGQSMLTTPRVQSRSSATTLMELAEIEYQRSAARVRQRQAAERAQPYQAAGGVLLLFGLVGVGAGVLLHVQSPTPPADDHSPGAG